MLNRKLYSVVNLSIFGAAMLTVSACTDHDWKGPNKNSERITFALQTANTDWHARSGGIEGCDIITLLDESTQDTLYLHPNISDMPAPDRAAAPRKGSRGEPIQNPDDFSRIQLNAQGVASFGITAYTSDGGQLYINNAEITRQNGKWEEAAPRFWPVEKLDFYGIAPYNALSADENNLKYNLTDKKVTFDYTVPHSAQGENRDAEAQHDIMMAFTGEQSKQTSSVTTKFWHILAGIQFEVADIAGGKINSITIRNVHGSGTATFDSSKIGGASAEDPTDSWQDNNTIPVTWVAADEPVVEYTQTFNVDVADQYPNQEAEGYDEQGVTSQNPKTTFLLMPQTLTDDAEIVINMTTLKDGEKTLTAKLGNGFTWKAGKIYKYTISTESINWTYVLKVEAIEKDADGERRPNWIDLNNNDVLDDGDYIYEDYDYSTFGHDGKGLYELGVQNYTRPTNGKDEPNYNDSTFIGYREKKFSYRVISYRYRTNAPEVTEPLPWAVTDRPDAKNDIDYREKGITSEEWMPGLTEANGLKGVGSVDGEGPYETLLYAPTLVTSYDKISDNYLYNNTFGKVDLKAINGDPSNINRGDSVGDQSTFYLLPTNGHAKSAHSVPYYSSNCYVVSAPGVYRIPLVIGSSLRGGQNNAYRDPYSYMYAVDDYETTVKNKTKEYPHKDALLRYTDFENNELKNAWIHSVYRDDPSFMTTAKAVMVWSDGYKLVTNVRIMDNEKHNYLVFEVPRKYIQQGNAVIGLIHPTSNLGNQAIDNAFVWSYHIWVTDHHTLLNDNVSTGKSRTYAKYPLGHCDPKDEWYTGRTGHITFTQYRADGITPTVTYNFNVHQLTSKYTTVNHNMTYYQHGRKDPFPGMQVLQEDGGSMQYRQKHIFYEVKDANGKVVDYDMTFHKSFVETDRDESRTMRIRSWDVVDAEGKGYVGVHMGAGIAYPYVLYYGTNSWHCRHSDPTRAYRNLWNNRILPGENDNPQENVDKTIYDPCFRDYVVPPYTAMQEASGLSDLGGTGKIVNGQYVDPEATYFWSSCCVQDPNMIGKAYCHGGTGIANTNEALPIWPIKENFTFPDPTNHSYKDETGTTITEYGYWDPTVYNDYYKGLEN